MEIAVSDSVRFGENYERLVQNIRDGSLTYLLVIHPNRTWRTPICSW